MDLHARVLASLSEARRLAELADYDQIAEFYDFPLVIVNGDKTKVLAQPRDLEAHFRSSDDSREDLDATIWYREILSIETLPDNLIMVNVNVHLIDWLAKETPPHRQTLVMRNRSDRMTIAGIVNSIPPNFWPSPEEMRKSKD